MSRWPSTPRPLVAGNWKMNGLKASAAELDAIIAGRRRPAGQGRPAGLPAGDPDRCRSPLAARAPGSRSAARIATPRPSGAFTGDISAEMLTDAGASAVIVGHSERRTDHHETDAEVHAKAQAAWRAGPDRHRLHRRDAGDEREAGQTLDVVGAPARTARCPTARPPRTLVIAYEPVWAIGTGLTPTPADVAEVHAFIRKRLAARFGAAGRGRAHPLWRLGEAVECRGADGRRQCRRRAGRRRQPEGRGFPRHRRALTR